MSWFTEIAGKAEDLLNRVDQTAATALQNKTKNSTSYDRKLHAANLNTGNTQFEPSYSDYRTYQSAPGNSASHIQSGFSESKRTYSHGTLTPMKKPESDDEKLLRYLNCNETLPASTKSKSNSMLTKEKDECQNPGSNSYEKTLEVEPVLNTNMENNSDACAHNVQVSDTLLSADRPIAMTMESATVEPNPNCDPVYDASNDTDSLETDKITVENDFLMAKKEAEHSKAEMKRMQKKLNHWNSQISENDKLVFELKEREKDLIAAMDAKDSQLAVLKVRLQEADQDLRSKITMVNDLKAENERIVKDHADGALFQNRTVENLRDQLSHVESELNKTKEAFHISQSENMQQMSKMEEEHKHLSENYTSLQKRWSDVNERNKDLLFQLKNATGNVESLQQEYNEYKQKAQRILQSKERLISSLKEGTFDADKIEQSEASSALLNAEIEGVKQERDILKDELRRANELAESYRIEAQELEKMAQNDMTASQDRFQLLKEQIEMEKVQKEEFQLLSNQLKEELQFLREDLSTTKATVKSRLQDREIEIEKLRRQLTAKSLSTVSQNELESRLHALTENLIQKQTVVEALSTEKNSLVLQLERLEQQLKEAQHFGSQHHTFVGVSNSEPEKKARSVFLENPFDSSLTRRVKKVYGTIDAFSIRLGVFFRRYPIARVFIIVYMLLLHLWVMIVLLTYEPEIHNSSYEHITKQ